MNINWPRWIFASTTKFFDANRQGYPLVIEGDDPRTDLGDNWFNFRLTGPTPTILSQGQYQLDITINILINSLRNDKDLHTIHRMIGLVQTIFDQKCISVYKYGDDVSVDDQSWLGNFQLTSNIQTDYYGQIDPDVRLLNATVQGDYRMFLTE